MTSDLEDLRLVSHGKVTFCLDCEGTGQKYRDDSCWDCGGFGLRFDGKKFSTSLTTTRVVPNKSGTKLIRPSDDLHDEALVKHHHKILKNKVKTIEKYRNAKWEFHEAKEELKKENITLPEDEL